MEDDVLPPVAPDRAPWPPRIPRTTVCLSVCTSYLSACLSRPAQLLIINSKFVLSHLVFKNIWIPRARSPGDPRNLYSSGTGVYLGLRPPNRIFLGNQFLGLHLNNSPEGIIHGTNEKLFSSKCWTSVIIQELVFPCGHHLKCT